jgi:phosphorylcholine metabolism protein LicD
VKKTFAEFTEEEKILYISDTYRLCLELANMGFQTHLNFGTLLGHVRDNDFIPTDDDIDICYLSNQREKKAVKQECIEIYRHLQSLGMLKKYWTTGYLERDRAIRSPFGQAHIFSSVDAKAIDLFTSWVDKDKNYWTCQWGNFGEHVGFTPIEFYGHPFFIPTNYDTILTRLYGDWRTPSKEKSKIKRKCYLI